MKFEEMGIKKEIVDGLKKHGITEPTDIQEIAIGPILEGKDVIAMSKTGSGKTATFAIPLLNNLVPGKMRQILIMCPTRELAVQIAQETKNIGKQIKFSIATIYGGVGYEPQLRDMSRSEIIVGTPGRLLDHLQNGNLDLSQTSCVVLDEADKMVEMGFIQDVERILSFTGEKKQFILLGATISNEINHLKSKFMHDPVVAKSNVKVDDNVLEQFYINVPMFHKFSLLVHLLKDESIDRVIIFCGSRNTVEVVDRNLKSNDVKSEMIHGKLSQARRLRIIENFHKGRPKILVASAVAARGLDIKDVTHIFNYDVPNDPQEYIHRIGRTARAGETGKAYTLLSENDYDKFTAVHDKFDVKIQKIEIEDFPKLRFAARGGQNSRQDSGNFRGSYRGNSSGGQGRRPGAGRGGFGGDRRSESGDSSGRSYARPSGRSPYGQRSGSGAGSGGQGFGSGGGFKREGALKQEVSERTKRFGKSWNNPGTG